MRISICEKVLLAGACMMAGVTGWAQGAHDPAAPASVDVAIVYHSLMTNVVGGERFWMQGGSVQIHGQFWHGLGVVADVSGLHAGSTNGSSVGLDLVTATFGPRYSWTLAGGRYGCFGQFLVGEANGLNSVFPGVSGVSDSASSMALLTGGGVNVKVGRRVAIRAFEAEWLRTQMPNSTTNVQNSLRLGAGLVFKFK